MDAAKYPEYCIFSYWFPLSGFLLVYCEIRKESYVEKMFQEKVHLNFEIARSVCLELQRQKLFPNRPICNPLEYHQTLD